MGDWRGQGAALGAIKGVMGDGELARELVGSFQAVLSKVEGGAELYAASQGGLYEVRRDALSRVLAVEVVGGTPKWVRISSMKEGEALHGWERAMAGAVLIVAHPKVAQLVEEVMALRPQWEGRRDDVVEVLRGDGDAGSRRAAARWLAGCRGGSGVVDALVEAASMGGERGHWAVKAAARDALVALGEIAVAKTISGGHADSAVIDLARGEGDAESRRDALLGLAQLGRGDAAAMIVVGDALLDPSSTVREAAGDALSELCRSWEECGGALEAAIRHPDAAVRRSTVSTVSAWHQFFVHAGPRERYRQENKQTCGHPA